MAAELHLSFENYGSQIPVFVREVLDATNGNSQDISNVTFAFNENAWSWLIAGRTVYVWNFKASNVLCFMLNLPQSGLKHSSDLFYVFSANPYDKQTNIPSCINVSPEGAIRFWLKVDAASTYIDNVVDLSGQVCQSLTKLPHTTGFVLATSTCNTFLVYPPLDRTNSFLVVPMKPSQSVVAGIGRRMTSLLFSSNVVHENKLIGVKLLLDRKQTVSSIVIVLTSKFIHCYQVSQPAGNYRFLWESDVSKIAIDYALEKVWNLRNQQVLIQFRPSVYINFIDMTVYDRKISILLAFRNEAVSQDVHLAVATFNHFDFAINDFDDFTLLNVRRQILYDVVASSYKLHFMHGTSNAFLVGTTDVYCFDLSEGSNKDCLRFTMTDDKIIGSSSFATHVLLFGIKSGLNRVKIGQRSTSTAFADEMSTLHQLTHTEDEVDSLVNSNDRYKRFKAAFICFLKQELTDAEKLLDELFDGDLFADANDLSVQLSLDIIDDYPAADARWANSVPSSMKLGLSGNSLLLLYQLNDKQKTLNLLWEFLKRMGVWKKLSECDAEDGQLIDCHWLLLEHAEKLDACVAVVEHGWSKISDLMQSVFVSVLRKRHEYATAELTPQDLFFRKVSKCDQLVWNLVEDECSDLIGYDQSVDKIRIISNANDIILRFLRAAQCRRAKFGQSFSSKLEYTPWTASDLFKRALIRQHSLTADYVNEALEPSRIDYLGQQLKELTECMLSDASDRLRSLKKDKTYEERLKEFESWRTKLIEPFIFLKQYEKACELGENFCDYEILVRVCEITNDAKLLDTYKATFEDRGFSEFFYSWNLNSGKYSRLFDQSDVKMKEFLSNRTDLKWIYDVRNGNFTKAAVDLLELADNETELLAKKKTLLSLAKLNALCNDRTETEKIFDTTQQGLDLISIQEKAPVNAVLKSSTQNSDQIRPLSVKELIEVFVTDEKADEWSFAKALELLLFYLHGKLSSDDFEFTKTYIWTSTILKDNWSSVLSSDDPLKSSTSTTFSKTVALLLKIYKDLEKLTTLLPSPDSLFSSQNLDHLNTNSVFRYILSARDEQLKNYLNSEDVDVVNID